MYYVCWEDKYRCSLNDFLFSAKDLYFYRVNGCLNRSLKIVGKGFVIMYVEEDYGLSSFEYISIQGICGNNELQLKKIDKHAIVDECYDRYYDRQKSYESNESNENRKFIFQFGADGMLVRKPIDS